MKKIKLNDVFVPRYRMYLILLLLVLIYMCLLSGKMTPVTILVSIVIYSYILFLTYRKNQEMKKRIIDTMNSFILKLKTDEIIKGVFL